MESIWNQLIITLIAGIAGGTVAPLFTEFLSSKSRKKRIRTEIIELVYLYYAQTKSYLPSINWRAYYLAKIQVERASFYSITTPSLEQKQQWEKTYAFHNSKFDYHSNRAEKLYDSLIHLESKIYGVIHELTETHDSGGKAIKSLIAEKVKKFNEEDKQLEEYHNMTAQELAALNLPQKLLTQIREIDKDLETVIGQIDRRLG